MTSKTIYAKFMDSAKKNSDRIAMKHKREGQFVPITYAELAKTVDAVATSMRKLGIKQGDKVAIASYNRPEWAIADLATLKLGAIVVPIYHIPGHLLPASYVKYILKDAGVKLLFVEKEETYSLVAQIKPETPSLQHIVLIEHAGAKEKPQITFDDMKKAKPPTTEKPADISAEDVATIVYTSGTTGDPKGVVLTHKNIIANASSAVERCRLTADDVIISYLPLAHMAERTCGYYTVLFGGGCIGYAEDPTTAIQDAEEIRPTLILTVPRVMEKAYSKAIEKVEGSSPIRRRLVIAAIENLNEYANRKYRKQRISLWLKLKKSIFDKLVASKFRKLGGGRIRLIVCGTAPLNRQIAKMVYILGFNIVEGYGLTETSPVVACNAIEDNTLGTVGRPIKGVDVRIGDNNEILVRGPNVMKGYHNRPEETARVIDKEGWLHTGDQGRFDKNGHLVITGRIKEIIVTAGGKNIAPTLVEGKITASRYVEHAMVFGDKKKYLAALVVPDRETIEQYAKAKNIGYDAYAQLLQKDEIKDLLKDEIRVAMTDLQFYEQVKAFALIEESFTVPNGLLTPSLKIRRKKIAEKYADSLDDMYVGREICAEKKTVCYF
jgi:long-chain acyl-CoA synthetase